MIIGVAIILVFLVFALLMYLNKLPALIALPLMAVSIALAAGISVPEVLTAIVAQGSYRLAVPIVTVIFGAILAQFIEDTGIARTIIRSASEFASDRPFVLLTLLTIVIAALFSVLGGLGAVIMIATIVFPIMLSLGIPRIVAACSFLIGMSLGGIFNLVNWQLYISVLGLSSSEVLSYALYFAPFMFIGALAFIIIELSRGGVDQLHAKKMVKKEVSEPWYSLFTPIIPIVLVFGFSIYNLVIRPPQPFEFPIIPAIIIGLLFGILTVRKKKIGRVQMLAKASIEGVSKVGPAILLLIGIGMILTATTHPKVAWSVAPLLLNVLHNNPIYYVAFFGLLAPLALYRGPLNIWGLGTGFIGLLLATKALPVLAIMAAFLSVGQIQGVCDPTNTHNIWIANYLGVSTQKILRKTIPYIWIVALVGLIIAGIRYF
ncbi:hypothetical protein ACFLZ2_06105 [Candidatus Margulisiibacteriota bacterium]